MRKIFTFLFAALMSVGMFATTYTVTFTDINSNVKVVENITLPHTFSCDYTNGNGELDLIIQEFYNEPGGHCSTSSPWGGNNNEVVVGNDGNNHFVTINAPFVGTSFMSGYYDGINESNFYYTFHITIAAAAPQLETDKTVGYVAFPTENRPASIELAGVNRDFTWPMAALQAAPWYITDYNFDNYLYTAVSDTIKFRDAANNAIVLCEFIPANGGQEGRWQQYYLKMADYEMALEKGVMVRLIDELDLSNASNYAWMENAPEPLPEGIEHIVLTEKAQKVIMDGMIYIVRDGKLFNLTGAQVK